MAWRYADGRPAATVTGGRDLVVLGTASQAPTRTRNHNGYLFRWDGEGLLFDPGEGLNSLRLLAPSGPGTWTPVSFRWTSPGVAGSGSTASVVELTFSRFNGRVLTLEVDLAGWEPAAPGPWLVEYVTAGGVVTDRTTWDVAVVDHVTP